MFSIYVVGHEFTLKHRFGTSSVTIVNGCFGCYCCSRRCCLVAVTGVIVVVFVAGVVVVVAVVVAVSFLQLSL